MNTWFGVAIKAGTVVAGILKARLLGKDQDLQNSTPTSINAINEVTQSRVCAKSSKLSLFTCSSGNYLTLCISTMKLHLGIALVVNAAGFIYTTTGLRCGSDCAACWKDGDPDGVDTKFSCSDKECGSVCPPGYHGIHCAKNSRCM